MPITVTVVGERDRALEDQLRAAGMRPASIATSDLASLMHPSSPVPDVVVLDLRTDTTLPPTLPLLRRQHPETAVIIIASSLDPGLMLGAMRAGVTECVTDLSRGDLEAAIARLVAQRAGPDTGDVFAFVGAKGGIGTTTAATNIAAVLAKLGSVLLIDLHLAGGDASLYLGAEPRFSVVDALENTHRLDAAYFRSLVVRSKDGPDVLASAERPSTGQVDPPRVRTLIDFAARHYRYSILDIPRSDSAVLESLDSVTTIVVVASQDLATVRGAARLATMLRQRYGRDKIEVVLSRADRRAEISQEDLERAIGDSVAALFPSDYRLAVEALHRGRPLVLDGSNPLANAFQAYARKLGGLGVDEAAPDKSGGLLGRLTRRR